MRVFSKWITVYRILLLISVYTKRIKLILVTGVFEGNNNVFL